MTAFTQAQKNIRKTWLLMGGFLIFIIFITGNISGAELSFLSFNNKDMTSFNLSFKQYIVAYKKFPEQEKGLKKLKEAIEKWGLLKLKP